MMFPSTDPMAYPIQPMSTFEDNHPQSFGFKHGSPTMAEIALQAAGIDINPSSPTINSPIMVDNPHIGLRRLDNEVQLLGPLPMYLMQGAQQRGFPPPPNSQTPQMSLQEGANVNFDEIFGGEEWAQTFMGT
jgi:hypothetical protein